MSNIFLFTTKIGFMPLPVQINKTTTCAAYGGKTHKAGTKHTKNNAVFL